MQYVELALPGFCPCLALPSPPPIYLPSSLYPHPLGELNETKTKQKAIDLHKGMDCGGPQPLKHGDSEFPKL